MPKNKTAINISKSLDLGAGPRSDAWHLSRFAAENPATGYAVSPAVMGFANSLSNTVYTQLNSLLGVPYRISSDPALEKEFGKILTAAPGGPSKYLMMLAGIPLATTEIEVEDEKEVEPGTDPPKVPQANLVGARTIPNAEFQCFANGYQQFPLYRVHQARFIAHMYAFYFGESLNIENFDPTDMKESVKDSLGLLIKKVKAIEEFFRCICRAYQSCGSIRPTDKKDPKFKNWNCGLGEDLKTQSEALGTVKNPFKFSDIVERHAPCGDRGPNKENFWVAIKKMGLDTRHLFGAADKIYAETVINTSDWNDLQNPRVNSIHAFMIVILALCDVAIKFRTLLIGLIEQLNALSGDAPSPGGPAGEQCTLPMAMHVYAKFFMRVWGPISEIDQAKTAGLPAYIISELRGNNSLLKQCAANPQACKNQAAGRLTPLPNWVQKLNFNDIGLPLYQNRPRT